MASRFVYYFGNGVADGGKEDKELLGGKGSNLAEMVRIGLPVPPGFTITTEVCRLYLTEKRYPEGLKTQVKAALQRLEQDMGKQFGGGDFPLLVSVRSGAAASMPGMMETILNLGLNDQTVEALAKATEQRAVRVRLLPPLHPDVLRRGAGDQREGVREAAVARRRRSRASSWTWTCRRRRCGRW